MEFHVLIRRIDGTDSGRAWANWVITELKVRRTVQTADVGLWRVPVFDKHRSEALDSIRAELDEIDPAWPEVLWIR
jgi:hypothetical protein